MGHFIVNMVYADQLPMPLYLLIASIANITFLGRSILDNVSGGSKPALNRFLVFMASAELCWVLPCFIQCFIVFIKGTNGSWSPDEEESGCDVQGFYSVFSAMTGQMMGLLAGWLTLQASRGEIISAALVSAQCAGIFLLSLLISALPFMGVGEFKYSGEGFCYFDWNNDTHLSLTLIVSLGSLIGGITLFVIAALQDTKHRHAILLFPLAFLFGWCLWPIASIIGLSSSSMPDHILITGAVLGHMQALINPALYGIVWRSMFVSETSELSDSGNSTPTEKKLVEPLEDSHGKVEALDCETIDVIPQKAVPSH